MMNLFRSLLAGIALAVLTSGAALAQCGTTAPANKFCGNDTGSQALATWKTIPAGALTPIGAGTVLGNPTGATAVPIATTAPVLGLPGTSTGQVGLAGATSGTAILRAQAAAGSAVVLMPTAAGTLAASASSPLALNATTGLVTCPTCVTSSGGGAITGVAPVSVSGAGAVSITGLAGGVLAGSGPSFTRTPVLGSAGSAVGSIGFQNLTSGTVTLQPVTGALGTVTINVPAAAGTMAVSATAPVTLSATGAIGITGSALTKTDDTNVTMTLGGSPSTALLGATSMTLGWTGQLGISRGGTGQSTASNAFTALAPTASGAGSMIYWGGSSYAALTGNAGAASCLKSAAGAPSWGGCAIVVDPVDYGADCSAVADSTAAVNSAIAALGANGGTVTIRNGCFLKVGGSGAQVFLITTPVRFQCQGIGSGGFLVTAATSATTDIFRIAPPSNTTLYSTGMSGCQVSPISGTPGRHVWNFDTTPGTTTVISDFLAEDSYFGTFGNYVFFNNTSGSTTSGGIYSGHFVRNVCAGSGSSTAGGCFGGSSWGDSNHINGGRMAGNGYAVNISLFASGGAGNFIIENANIVSSGMVKIDGGYKIIIQNNTLEQQLFTNTSTNNAVIDINGAIAQNINATVVDNLIVVGASLGNPTPLRISNAASTTIDGNRFSVPTNYPAIAISAPASDTRIGCMNVFNGSSPAYSNSTGSGTQICSAPTVISSNVNFNSVGDTTIPIVMIAPRWVISSIEITACTGSAITSAHFGVFTATGGGGTAIVANTTGTITTGADNAAGNMQLVSATTGFTQSFNLTQVYFRVITAQGSAASCNVNFVLLQLP